MTILALVGLIGGCPTVQMPPGNNDGGGSGGGGGGGGGTTTPPQAFTDANLVRGGTLYDKFWAVAGLDAPTADHPLWSTRPDMDSNTRTGADTWRCKECHGWDYKGVDGVYGSGSHRTGFAGIFTTSLSAQAVFDLIKTDHAYGGAGLTDADVWDLAKFVLEGQIDTDTIIDTSGAFTGDVAMGQSLYDSGGDGLSIACGVCHGADGLLIEFEPGEFLGTVASDNPWEFQHKVRFGQPSTAMPSVVKDGGTDMDVADIGAYSQTLPTSR